MGSPDDRVAIYTVVPRMSAVAELGFDTLIELGVLVKAGDVPPDRLDPWHTVTLTESAWRMAHPVFCDLECEFQDIAVGWEEPPDVEGVYRWGPNIDEDWERVEV